MEDTPTAETQGYPALMQPRIAQPKARPFRIVASERHYPLAGWRRCWSRGDPHPFEFEDSGRPCAAPDGDGWRVEVRDATDQEGWLYGTAFERLNDHRKGGRAAKRSTDRCRRRVWVHSVDAGPAPVEDEEIVEDDGTSLFWRVCRATLGRRPLQDYPMDPTAWYRVRRGHERFYDEWVSKPHPEVMRAQLVDLAHAFLYCRAAYGFAMAEGHMDSLSKGAALFTYKKVAYFDPAEDCCGAENTRSLRSMAGLSEDSVLCAKWSIKAYKPSFFVCLDHSRRWVVVGIRGTVATRDLLADVTASQVKFLGGRAHLGFLRCAAFVEKAAAEALRKAHENYADYDLVLCGHSMGASVAALLALAHVDDDSVWPAFSSTKVYCMAAGPCVSRNLAEACKSFCLGAVRGRDPIARLSVLSVEALLDELVDQGLGRRLQQLLFGAAPSSEARGAVSVAHTDDINENVEVPLSGLTADLDVFAESVVAEAAPEKPVVAHGNSRAIAAALAETESSVREPLLLPGEVVHVDRLATGPVAFAANAGDYERLLLSNALLGHHLPAGYCDLLLELSGAYTSEEASDALAALRTRVIASDWARPADHRAVLT